nr:complement receptor type 2-like [Chelonoidis abingdonii]
MPRPGEATYAFEDRVTIECDFGYDIKDSINRNAQIHCKRDGTWDPAVPVCEPVCAQPPNISHGQYNDWGKRVFVVGSSVTYKCDRGFSLVGKASIQCIAGDEVTPTWSEPTPQCEETQCTVPRIQHGSPKSPLPHNYTYRTSVTFQCDPGYILRGPDRVQCQADGKWYPQLPICDLVITTQDKPTTVPPEGAEVAGTSSGSVLNTPGNSAEPEGHVIVIAIGISTGIGIVVLGAVPAIIASAILKKNRIKVNAS